MRAKTKYLTSAGLVEATPVWFLLLLDIKELETSALHSYYFCDWAHEISAWDAEGAAVDYLPLHFELDDIGIDTSQKMASIGLTIDNINKNFTSLVQFVELTTGRCILARGFLEDLSDPACMQIVFRGSIRYWKVASTAIKLEIGSDIPLINKAPRRRFTSYCQWRFKDANTCQYSGAETTCDKSYATCKALSNIARFGGFPFIAKSRDPRNIWVKDW